MERRKRQYKPSYSFFPFTLISMLFLMSFQTFIGLDSCSQVLCLFCTSSVIKIKSSSSTMLTTEPYFSIIAGVLEVIWRLKVLSGSTKKKTVFFLNLVLTSENNQLNIYVCVFTHTRQTLETVEWKIIQVHGIWYFLGVLLFLPAPNSAPKVGCCFFTLTSAEKQAQPLCNCVSATRNFM